MSEQVTFEKLKSIWTRRKWVALPILAVFVAVGVSAATFLPSLYRATAVVMVERPQVMAATGLSATREVETQIESLTQENLNSERLVELASRYELYPELRQNASASEIVQRFLKDITIEKQKVDEAHRTNTVAMRISVRASTPEIAATVANELASFYVKQDVTERKREAKQVASTLKVQLEALRGQLDEDESKIRSFKSRFRDELPEQTGTNLGAIERLYDEMREVRREQDEIEDEKKALRDQLDEIDGKSALSERLAELHRELRQLRTQFTEQHPDVRRLRAEIAAINREAASGGRKATPGRSAARARVEQEMSKLDRELVAMQTRERELQSQIMNHEHKVLNAPLREQQLASMVPEYDTMRSRFNETLGAYNAALMAGKTGDGLAAGIFRLMDAAQPPKFGVAPNRIRIMVITLLLAIIAAAVGMTLAEWRDNSFHSVSELRAFTRVPVLASVPVISTPADVRRRQRNRILGIALGLVVLALIVGGVYGLAHGNEQLVMMLASRS